MAALTWAVKLFTKRRRARDPGSSSQTCQHVLGFNKCQVKESESHSVMFNSLRPHGLDSLWNSPGQNTGVGSLSLLQGIFPTQGSNPGLLHCRRILYQLNHQGSPGILEGIVYAFSSGSSRPRIKQGSPELQVDSLPVELPGCL